MVERASVDWEVSVGGLTQTYKVRLIEFHHRWWWFITSSTAVDSDCLRGDCDTKEHALQMALYYAKKLVSSP
jgi:hypothetical protein